jgi:hypothetical protein
VILAGARGAGPDRQLVEADPTVRLTTGDRINILVPVIPYSEVNSTAIEICPSSREEVQRSSS